MKTRLAFGLTGLAVLTACQDSGVRNTLPVDPSYDISEGRTGGNPDLFFGTPLATNPQPGDANFEVGFSHALLVPYTRICETNGAPNATGCVVDVTLQITGSPTGLVMGYNSGSELYTASLQTKTLDITKDYRIEIWGVAFSTPTEKAAQDLRWLFGWLDIRNAPQVSACDGTGPFCLINFGQKIPVKVRIEQFVFCPLTRNCGMQFVTAGVNANLEAQLGPSAAAPSAQLFIPGQAGTNLPVALEPCSAAEDAAVTSSGDFPMYGPCLKTVSQFTGTLGTPAIISLCDDLDPTSFGLSHDQEEQVALHHFSNDLTRIQALPEAWQCDVPTSGLASAKSKGVRYFARALRDRLIAWASPTPLHAAALDRGGGGESPFIASFFKLGLPVKFEYVAAADASQQANAGTTLVLSAKVTDLTGAPVNGARVRWQAISPPSDGATVLGSISPATTLTNASGIAQSTATLNPFRGFNVYHAYGRGIADDRNTGCVVPPSTPSSCNGPRSTYDPFIPFHVPEFDPSGVEAPVEIPLVSRLLFTIFGRGKPAP
jgi:hypothetical protein